MRINIEDAETGEWYGTVTTRYNDISTLMENVQRWMRRHPGFRYVDSEELDNMGLKWNKETFYVTEIR